MGQAKRIGVALALCAVLAPAEAFNLTIVHWNDVHARNTPASESTQQLCLEEPYTDPSCYGGHARIATICKETKASNPATLCIDAGDEISGTTWDVLFQGAQTAPVLEAAGTDVMGLGNHEFDFGVASLAAFIGNVTFPILGACNMDTSLEPSLNVKKWHVATLSGIKVALLGVIVDTTANISSAGAVTFSDPVAAVPLCMQEFMASPDSTGVNIIGLVSHVGVSTDRAIAQAAPGLDFIVSAHSHTPMFPGLVGECLNFTAGACGAQDESAGEYPEIASGVPILQQFFASKYVGVATLTFDPQGNLTGASGKSVPLGTYYDAAGTPITVAEDAEVAALLQDGYTEVVGRSLDVVGSLPTPLSAARPDIRIQEMPLANMICSAMIDALNDTAYKPQAGVPVVCIMNGGGIRADLPAGNVTFGDVATTLPFGNVVEVLQITGLQLKQALEFGYDSVEDVSSPPGKYPHLGGGLTVVINSALPAGQRIVSLQYNCANITDTDTLHLVTNDFLGRGGDGYAVLDGIPKVLGDVLGPPLDAALADYLTDNTPTGGSVPQSLLAVDGRFYDLSKPGIPLCPIDGSGALAPTAAIPPGNGTAVAGDPNGAVIAGGAAAPTAAEPANSTVLPGVAPIAAPGDGATATRGASVESSTNGCRTLHGTSLSLKTLLWGFWVSFLVAGFR